MSPSQRKRRQTQQESGLRSYSVKAGSVVPFYGVLKEKENKQITPNNSDIGNSKDVKEIVFEDVFLGRSSFHFFYGIYFKSFKFASFEESALLIRVDRIT